MAASNLGIEFVLRGDGSSALNAINSVQKGINKLGDSVKNDLTQKLKSLFTVAAMEEVARRTEDWAHNLTQVSQAIGVTTTDMQIFNIIATNAKVGEGKVTEFFTSFANARDEAIKGNTDMIQSLQALGTTYGELTSKASNAQLFEKLLGNKDIGNIQQGSAMSRAVSNVFGAGNLFNLQSVVKTAGPNALDPAKYGNMIVPDKDVSELAAMWATNKNDMKKIFTESIPAIKFLVALLNSAIKAILGVIQLIKDVFDVGMGIVKGDTVKIKSSLKHLGVDLANMVIGLLKSFTSVIDAIGNILFVWARKIPGLKNIKNHSLTEQLTNLQNGMEKKAGTDKDPDAKSRRENMDALGSMLPMLAGSGIATKLLGKVGLGETALNAAVKAEGLAGTLSEIPPVSSGFLGQVKTIIGNAGAYEGRMMVGQMMGKASEKLFDFATMMEKMGPAGRWIGGIASIIGKSGSVLMASSLMNKGLAANGGVNSPDRAPYNAQIIQQNPFSLNGESTSMLKMGGVFGSGIQIKMLRLTEQMVSILNQISKNTNYYNPYNQVNPQTQPAGGQ